MNREHLIGLLAGVLEKETSPAFGHNQRLECLTLQIEACMGVTTFLLEQFRNAVLDVKKAELQ